MRVLSGLPPSHPLSFVLIFERFRSSVVICSFFLLGVVVLKASLDEVESMEGLLELDDKMQVMIISDENEMGQVR